MFNTVGRLKSASGLYCVQFFISLPRDASAERGYEIACHPSVGLSVRNDQVPWSRRLEFFENNLTAE